MLEPELQPDEPYPPDYTLGWCPRVEGEDPDAIKERFADWLRRMEDTEPEGVVVVPVLMREESEVEAQINGHEYPYMQECTTRARDPKPFWRIAPRPEEES